MMTEMSRLGSFTATPITETLKSERGERGYEWTMRVTYAQRVKRSGGGGAAERAEARP
jgi:hypothetical protein